MERSRIVPILQGRERFSGRLPPALCSGWVKGEKFRVVPYLRRWDTLLQAPPPAGDGEEGIQENPYFVRRNS